MLELILILFSLVVGIAPMLIVAAVIFFAVRYSNKNKLQHSTGNRADDYELNLAKYLEDLSKRPEYSQDKKSYMSIVQALRQGEPPIPSSINFVTEMESEESQEYSEKSENILPPASSISMQSTSSSAAATEPAIDSVKQVNPFHLVQNINVLLYLGAFLVVVSTAILVGVNFDNLSGIFKFALVTIFALLFYGTGLIFYLKMDKLKQAGITFMAIGLIMLPFLGLAYRNFIDSSADLSNLWFVTSVLSLVFYLITLLITKTSFLEYLMMLGIISTVGSGLVTLNLELYWLAWVGVILAVIFQVASELLGSENRPQISTLIMAHILAPFSLFYGIINAGIDSSALQLSVSLILVSIFYSVTSFTPSISNIFRSITFSVSLFLAFCATLIYVSDVSELIEITSVVASLLASLYVLIGLGMRKLEKYANFRSILFVGGTIGFALACLLSIYDLETLSIVLLITAIISIFGFLISRSNLLLSTGLTGLLILIPTFIDSFSLGYETKATVSLSLYTTLILLLSVAQLAKSFLSSSSKQIIDAFVHIAVIFGLLTSFLGFNLLPSAIFTALAALFYLYKSIKYSSPGLVFLSGLVWQVAIALFLFFADFQLFNITIPIVVWVYMLSGLMWFVAGAIPNRKLAERLNQLFIAVSIIGLITVVFTWLAAFTMNMEWDLVLISTILSVVAAASSRIFKQAEFVLFAMFVLLVGVYEKTLLIDWLGLQNLPLTFGLTAVLAYTLSFLPIIHQKEKTYIQVSSVIALMIASFTGGLHQAITSNFVLAAVLGHFSYAVKSRTLAYLSLGVVTLSLMRLLQLSNIEELQIYTHIWASYFALLAWLEAKRFNNSNKDLLTVTALTVLTIPALFQAVDASELWLAVLLVVESLALVIIGIATKYKLVIYWGVTILVLEVLYQSREVIFAIPKYLFTLILGLSILGVSVYLLNRRNDNEQ